MEDYGVAKGYIELDIENLESNIKSAIKHLDELERKGALTESEFNKLQSGVVNIGGVFQQAAQKSKILASQIDQAKQKCGLYESEIKALNTIIDQAKTKQAEWSVKIKEAESSQERAKKRVADLSDAYKAAQQEMKAASKEYGNGSTQVKELEEKHSKLIKSYENAEKALVSSKNTLIQYQNAQEACGIEIEQSGQKITEFKTKLNNTQASINRMSVELAQAQSKAMQFGEAMKGVGEKFQNVGGVLDTWGNRMSMAVTVPLVSAGTASAKMASDAETSFAKVSTIADQTVLSYEKMESGVTKASNDTGIAITDFNEALYSSLSAGVETGQAIGFTTDMVKLAKGGFTDTAKAVDVVTSVLNAYGLSADQASNISDKLITTQNIGKTTVDELASSLGRVIPTAKAFNVDMDNVSASMAILTKRGIQTAEATTYYNSMLNELGKSGSVADEALRKLSGKGFSQLIAEGTPLTTVLQMLSDEAANNGKSLSDMFGSMEAGKAALSIMSDGGAEYNQVLEEMRNSAGATQEAFDKMDATSAAQMQKELNKLKNAGIEAGKQLLPVVTDTVKEVGNLAEKFGKLPSEQQKAIVKTATFAAGAGPALKVTGLLTSGLGKLAEGFGGVIKAAGKTGALKTAAKNMEGIGSAAKAAGAGTGVMSTAISALASPVGIAVASMAALAGGVYLANKADEARIETLSQLTGKEKELADAIDAQHESYTKMAEHRESSLESINAETARTKNLADELRTLVDENGRVKAGNEDRAAFVTGELSSALGQEISLVDGVVQEYGNLCTSIDDTIEKQKALAIQEALKDDYAEAVKNKVDAQNKYNEQLRNAESNAKKLSDAESKLTAIEEEYNHGIGLNTMQMGEYNDKWGKAHEEVETYTKKLKNSNKELEKAEEDLIGYNETVQNYEGLSSAILSEDAEQISMALLKIQEGFQTAETGTRESLEKQKTTIQEKYEEMAEALANGAPGVTQESVDQIKALADQADAELAAKINQDKQTLIAKFKECGIEAPQGMIDALVEKSPETQAAVTDMLSSMSSGTALKKEELKSMFETLGIESTEGLINSISEQKPYVQAEAIELLAQLQSAEESKRPEIISQLQELGIEVDDSLAGGIESNGQKVSDASGSVGEKGNKAMQEALSGQTLNPPNVNGITGTTYSIGLAGNSQMGVGLKISDLTPPGVNDINGTSNNIGVAGNTQMGAGLKNKNLDPPKINDIDGRSKAQKAKIDMQSYFDNNPLSVVVNVAKKLGGAISSALFADGGIATEPSIFGEDGPEMAIPLAPGKRARALALYEQTGDLLGISQAESAMRREALENFSPSYLFEKRTDTGDIIFNAPEIDYDLLAEKISNALRSSPIQPIVEMKDGDVYLDNERVGRKQAPVISRIISQNT